VQYHESPPAIYEGVTRTASGRPEKFVRSAKSCQLCSAACKESIPSKSIGSWTCLCFCGDATVSSWTQRNAAQTGHRREQLSGSLMVKNMDARALLWPSQALRRESCSEHDSLGHPLDCLPKRSGRRLHCPLVASLSPSLQSNSIHHDLIQACNRSMKTYCLKHLVVEIKDWKGFETLVSKMEHG
jgi:hypothetical protein